MTNAQIARHFRALHNHSVISAAFSICLAGVIYTLCVEWVSSLIRRFWQKLDPDTMLAAE